MSDQKHPIVQKLHNAFIGEGNIIWKTLTNEQQVALKEAATEIEFLAATFNSPPTDEVPRFGTPRYEAQADKDGSLALPAKDGTAVLWKIVTRSDKIEEIFAQIEVIQEIALRRGFIPADHYIDQRRQGRELNQMVVNPSSQVVTSQPPTNGQLTFTAQSIVAAPMSDKKPDLIWKIRGNKSKFPVAIYEAIEEVKPTLLKEGIDLSTFVTQEGKLKEFQLSGWVAHYEANDKGFPAKVVQLVKAS